VSSARRRSNTCCPEGPLGRLQQRPTGSAPRQILSRCLCLAPKATSRFLHLAARGGNRHGSPGPLNGILRPHPPGIPVPPPQPGHELRMVRSSVRFSDSRINLLPTPSQEISQWHPVGFVPVYSGGSATASNRFPCPLRVTRRPFLVFFGLAAAHPHAAAAATGTNIPKDPIFVKGPVRASEVRRGTPSTSRSLRVLLHPPSLMGPLKRSSCISPGLSRDRGLTRKGLSTAL
jgi:hypothetical protein